jgi:GH15 family glucan-1,4-alpha-glucosidase
LRRGSLEWIKNSDESRIVSFARRAGEEEVLVAINFSNRPFEGTIGGANVSLNAWEFKVRSGKGEDFKTLAQWPTAAKNGFGTSITLNSKVWFTLAGGIMTEVFYPTIDTPLVKTLQLTVRTDYRTETEANDTVHRLELPNPASLTFRQVNTAKSGHYTITKTYVTDPRRNSVLIDVQFDGIAPARLSTEFEPSSNNKGNARLLSNCDSKPQATFRCTIAVGFGQDVAEATRAARSSLARGFTATRREYEAGWRNYVAGLPRIDARHQRQFNMAAMVLRGLEDKTFRGAVIASPSRPWGGGPNSDEATASGYHAVWSRDLYHVATAFMALGDRATANRVLDYLFRVQQKPDGSFPRNSWVDGRPTSEGLQMDQVALPLVLAYQLERNDAKTWRNHVKPAADFIVRHGPQTDQDRWEERSGIFPATVAAEIAGLVCAAEIAAANADVESATAYRKTADDWKRDFERYPTTGVDAGFLEFVRLGIKTPDDKWLRDHLAQVDQVSKVATPAGEAWYRYPNDTYGETRMGGDFNGVNGVGRLWTFLTGERGEYEIAAGDLVKARKRLDTLAAFANEGLMIPEQVWETSGTGTRSATPLAWSMAQFIRLAMNIEKGRNLEMPKVVWERYAGSPAKAQSRQGRPPAARRVLLGVFAPLREKPF